MKKLRKTISLALLSVALFAFAPTSVQAQNCDPCDPCDWGGIDIGVDYLYWKPVVDNLEYAAELDASSSEPFEYKFHDVCPDWESGVRVYLGWQSPCWNLGLRGSWTYVDADESDSVGNPKQTSPDPDDIFIAFTHPGLDEITPDAIIQHGDFGKGEFAAKYNEWDFLVTYNFHDDGCHRFTPFFGVAGIDLDQEFKVKLVDFEGDQPNSKGFINRSEWDSDLWAVGLRIGAEYSHQLFNCITLFANGHGSVLTGEATSKVVYFDRGVKEKRGPRAQLKFKDDDCHQLIPGYHITTGLAYESDMCGCEYAVRVGYEFLAWHNVPNHRVFVGEDLGFATDHGKNVALATTSNTRTFGFHGLFVGAQMSF